MSQYDDDPADSGTMCNGLGFWVPFESPANLRTFGKILRENKQSFFQCAECVSILDVWDVAVGDFGDIHCAYCGGNNIKFPSKIK